MLQSGVKRRFRDFVKPCFSFPTMEPKNSENLATLGGRLKAALKAAGMRQNVIAAHFDVTEQAVSQWFRDETAPDMAKMFDLAKLLGVRAEWMMHGTGQREAEPAPPESRQFDASGGPKIRQQPLVTDEERLQARHLGATNDGPDLMLKVLGMAEGGPDGWNLFNGEVVQYIRRPDNLIGVPGAYAVYVSGDSMEPRYQSGEIVHIHPARPVTPGAYVLVQRFPEHEGDPPSAVVKRLVKRTGNKVILEQHNPAKQIELKASEILSMHRIVGSSEA